MATKVKKDAPTKLTVKDGAVEVEEIQQEELEVKNTPAEDGKPGNPTIEFGEAVYEYVGDCFDCLQKRPPRTTPVFHCRTHPVRADVNVGDQLAAYWNDGPGGATKLCQDCYRVRLGKEARPEPRYIILPK